MSVENWWEENYSTEDTKTSLQDSKKSDESVPVEDSVDSITFKHNNIEYPIPKKWFKKWFKVGGISFLALSMFINLIFEYNDEFLGFQMVSLFFVVVLLDSTV